MAYIRLEQGEVINKGNFSFIFDITKNNDLYNKFLEAEQVFKINYIDFSHKMRLAYEAFALFEEVKRRMKLSEYTGKSYDDIEKLIVDEINIPASIFNYKNIIINLCKGREIEFNNMLQKYSYSDNIRNDFESKRAIKNFLKYIYNFGSKSSHINNNIDLKYEPNRKNCLRVLSSFHDFLLIYYRVNHKFDSTLIPIRDYVPVNKSICKKMGINFGVGRNLFVREKNGKITYSVFSSYIEDISLSQKRNIETINKLWEENFEDPSNIIRLSETISASNSDYKYQVYSLPGRPMKINKMIIDKLNIDEKIDIIKGICRGIKSMHEYDPPFYHRNICPNSFYIFKIREKYKALLTRFDCTKDTADDSEYTVINTVEKKILNDDEKVYFAPEVTNSCLKDTINWEKADIYSLAQVFIYLLVGEVSSDFKKNLENLDKVNINDNIKYIILEMISENLEQRPSIKYVLDNIN